MTAHQPAAGRPPSTLSELSDVTRFADLSAEHAEAFRRLAATLIERGRAPGDPAWAFAVPGRIELVGKHTDYAGGRSLTCATEQGFCMIAMARADRRLEIDDVGRAMRAGCAVDAELEPQADDWMRYTRVVARRVARDFGREAGSPELRGADVAITSDLPPAAGMSSSSALVVGLFQALAAVNRLDERSGFRRGIPTVEALAGYLGAVESGRPWDAFGGDLGVGTFGGSEDHTAILCSAGGSIGQFSYAPVRRERSIEAPAGHVFAVVSSGVRAAKAGAQREDYNRLSLAAAELARSWREATGGTEPDLATILAAPDAAERLREAVSTRQPADRGARELLDRLEHFRQESEILVPQAGDALESGDLAVFGLVVDRSQHLAERLLGNQIAETVALAEGARELGAAAASAFGAGFGGAVWALVEESEADELVESWLAHYLESFPQREETALAVITAAARPFRRIGG